MKKAAADAKAARESELDAVSFKDGEYQVQVCVCVGSRVGQCEFNVCVCRYTSLKCVI